MPHESTVPHIEAAITAGNAIWLASVEYDPIEGSLTLHFSSNLDRRPRDRSIIFRKVMAFHDKRHEEEFGITPGLLGIGVDGRLGATHYTITTDVTEAVIVTTEKPEIIFH